MKSQLEFYMGLMPNLSSAFSLFLNPSRIQIRTQILTLTSTSEFHATRRTFLMNMVVYGRSIRQFFLPKTNKKFFHMFLRVWVTSHTWILDLGFWILDFGSLILNSHILTLTSTSFMLEGEDSLWSGLMLWECTCIKKAVAPLNNFSN